MSYVFFFFRLLSVIRRGYITRLQIATFKLLMREVYIYWWEKYNIWCLLYFENGFVCMDQVCYVRAYSGGWPCSNWARIISHWFFDMIGWSKPACCRRDSSDLTRWRAAGLTAASSCLWDHSDMQIDHVIHCLISSPVNSMRTLDFIWISSY